MQLKTRLFGSAVFLSLVVAFLWTAPSALAGNAGPAPGNDGTVQTTGTAPGMSYSAPTQLGVVMGQGEFVKAYQSAVKPQPTTEVSQTSDGVNTSQVPLQAGNQYNQKASPGTSPTRVEAAGFILPNGRYMWDGRVGQVPNPTLAMPGYIAPLSFQDSGMIGPTMALLDAVDHSHGSRTTAITNGDFAAITAAKGEMLNEMRAQPDRWRPAMRAALNEKISQQANQTAMSAENNMDAGWQNVQLPLINIANEEAWQPCTSEAPWKSYANSAWMVGQMYKQVYIPMAILLLLPGVLLSQLKVIIKTGFVKDPDIAPDPDMFSPFNGIMRAMVAIFLIPATQLFISYTIDVGNSLTWEITNSPYWNMPMLQQWRNQQTYNAQPQNDLNYFQNNPESQMQGKAQNTPENQVAMERENYLTSTNQHYFNMLNALLGQGMVALNAFQLVMMMYLFLLGPVAAALFAWPGANQQVFRYVYANWMDGVVLVTLWKFWWAVILLCMMVRLEIIAEANGGSLPISNDQFEMFMCASFCALLMYVPFNPFDFNPGSLVQSVLDDANSQVSKGGSGAAVVGSTSPTGGSGSQGHQGSKATRPSGTGKGTG